MFDGSGEFHGPEVLQVRLNPRSDDAQPSVRKRPSTIESKVGDTFTIPLEANHTTGYSWRLAQQPDPRFSNSSAKNMMRTPQVAPGLAGSKPGRFRQWPRGLRHSFSNTCARSKKMCRPPRFQSSESQFSRNARQIAEPAGVTLSRARPPYRASP